MGNRKIIVRMWNNSSIRMIKASSEGHPLSIAEDLKRKKDGCPGVKRKHAPQSTSLSLVSPGLETCGNSVKKGFLSKDH